MSVPQRTISAVRSLRAASLVSIAALAAAGCSANVMRLDAPPSFALGEGASTANPNTRRANAGGPADPAPPSNSYASTPRSGGNVEMAGLPPLSEPASPPVRAMAVTRQAPPAAPSVAGAREAAAPSQIAKGPLIEVQPGDTLYGIGKRHKVMISELMSVNELKNPNLKPGQKLYLPAGARGPVAVKPARGPQPLAPQGLTASSDLGASPAVPAPGPASASALAPQSQADASGATYTVKPGDSLYAIAARHKVKLLDLQRVNQIADAKKVKPGVVLRIPGAAGSGDEAVAAAPAQPQPAGEPRIVRVGLPPQAPSSSPTTSGLKMLNGDGPARVATAEPTTRTDGIPTSAAPPVAAATGGKLRWPAKGRIVQGFGPRPDGTHNDGVDIAVPAGTDVLAAESGVVAYAGNEVKTYGNLVLIRHDNGWVTAYAYNEKILVNRGDRVKRGQPIAKAGKTGTADQPQVHFEVRVGSKPVDPTGYLDKI